MPSDLDYPVVSGNVSLYNETDGTGILPTPAIGGVGLIEDYAKAMTMGFKAEGETVLVLGRNAGDLGQSLWLREIHGREDGAPPQVDLQRERATGDFVRQAIRDGLVTAVHDVSDGGLLVAVAEMALAGNLGVDFFALPVGYRDGESHMLSGAEYMFAEDQGRFVVTTSDPESLHASALEAGVFAGHYGVVGGTKVSITDATEDNPPFASVSLAALRAAHEGAFPAMMAAAT